MALSPEVTVTLVSKMPIWKQGILKSLISLVLNCTGWIKLIFDTVDLCNFVINEFKPTFKVQGRENG